MALHIEMTKQDRTNMSEKHYNQLKSRIKT
jgi:predicted small metal-binding protein